MVLESGTDVVVEVFLGTAIDMEGLGDGSYDVVAVSHNAILDESSATLADVGTSQVGGCVSLSDEVVTLQGQTCEIPHAMAAPSSRQAQSRTPRRACWRRTARWCLLVLQRRSRDDTCS